MSGSLTSVRPAITASSATFSRDRVHRFTLLRRWGDSSVIRDGLIVIGLNPSTADETLDDPTIRRCMGFAHREGLGGLVMLNAFSLRATLPAVMKASAEPNVSANDAAIRRVCRDRRVVVAWGAHGGHHDRDAALIRLLDKSRAEVVCFGTTRQGFPRHPLYLPRDASLEPYAGRMPR